MTWRAINNALAGLLAGVAGGVLLGALIVIWGVTVFTLATSVDNWEHVAVYVGIVVLITVLTPWLVHRLSAMQRSRLERPGERSSRCSSKTRQARLFRLWPQRTRCLERRSWLGKWAGCRC